MSHRIKLRFDVQSSTQEVRTIEGNINIKLLSDNTHVITLVMTSKFDEMDKQYEHLDRLENMFTTFISKMKQMKN